ncbi:MAG: MerR family transcriptional regulator [Oscillospiraceae bacterium]|nr:MerR family transcriptional regulator [Oscillospiraceae bacterium]
MYRIGEFSKLCRTTLKTLRYYDEVGLLKPAYVDEETSYRFYTPAQADELQRIQSLRQIGLSIGEIRQILDGCSEREILGGKRRALEGEIHELVRRINQIDFLLGGDDGAAPHYVPTLKVIPPMQVLSAKLTLPDEGALFRCVDGIWDAALAANPGVRRLSPPYAFVTYIDTEYREKQIRIEYFEAVDAAGEACGNVRFKTLPQATVLSVLHRGPYADLPAAYLFCYAWAQRSNCLVMGRPRECYIDGPWNKRDPSQYLTELQVPIVAAEAPGAEV